MGNSCYMGNCYSDIIQTREYRSPEIILGGEYDETADIWSMACTVFELVTGQYLFNPRRGKHYGKNDDHLALIAELIGPCEDYNFIDSCFNGWKFIDKQTMRLKRISDLEEWPLEDVLYDKYGLELWEARPLAEFLELCL